MLFVLEELHPNESDRESLVEFDPSFNPYVYNVQKNNRKMAYSKTGTSTEFIRKEETKAEELVGGINSIFYLDEEGNSRLLAIEEKNSKSLSKDVEGITLEDLTFSQRAMIKTYQTSPEKVIEVKIKLREKIIKQLIFTDHEYTSSLNSPIPKKIKTAFNEIESMEDKKGYIKDIKELYKTFRQLKTHSITYLTDIFPSSVQSKKIIFNTDLNPKQYVDKLNLMFEDYKWAINSLTVDEENPDKYKLNNETLLNGLKANMKSSLDLNYDEFVKQVTKNEKIIDIIMNIIIYNDFVNVDNTGSFNTIAENEPLERKKSQEILDNLSKEILEMDDEQSKENITNRSLVMVDRKCETVPIFKKTQKKSLRQKSDTGASHFGALDPFRKDKGEILLYDTFFKEEVLNPTTDAIAGYGNIQLSRKGPDIDIDLENSLRETSKKLSDMLDGLTSISKRQDISVSLFYRNSLFIRPACFTRPLELTLNIRLPFDIKNKKFEQLGCSVQFNPYSFAFQIISEPMGYIGNRTWGVLGSIYESIKIKFI